jgi:hypothetical protein
VILLPFVGYLLYEDTKLTWHYQTTMQRGFKILALSQWLSLYLLILYWYYLIVVGIGKMMGFIKKREK